MIGKVKVLFIHHARGWGGAPINMINIINSLDKSRFNAEVLLIKDSIVSEMLKENNINYMIAKSWFYKKFYKYYSHTIPGFVPWYNVRRQIVGLLSWILSRYYFAKRELQKHEFDLVHLNSSVLTDWLFPSAAKGKVIMHIQEPVSKGYLGLRHSFFTKQMRKYADCIIAISSDNAKRINIPEKTEIVYNYVKRNNFSNTLLSKAKKVVYVGGQASIKGFETVVRSLKYLNDGVVIKFAGSYQTINYYAGFRGYLRKILHHKQYQLIKTMRKSINAIEIGLINENDVVELIKNSIVLISPSSKVHFSRPVTEAFAMSTPAIGSNIEGMDEIIDHNINGLIVAKDNPKELANAINYLCSNPDIVRKMGANGYLKAIKNYSPDNVRKIEQIYDELLTFKGKYSAELND